MVSDCSFSEIFSLKSLAMVRKISHGYSWQYIWRGLTRFLYGLEILIRIILTARIDVRMRQRPSNHQVNIKFIGLPRCGNSNNAGFEIGFVKRLPHCEIIDTMSVFYVIERSVIIVLPYCLVPSGYADSHLSQATVDHGQLNVFRLHYGNAHNQNIFL